MMTDEKRILAESRTIAVVGLSPNPFRPSHEVAEYMMRAGYRIIPVNPGHKEILGERCYARLEEIPEPVDCVNIFRRAEHVAAIVDAAIAMGARAVWMQLEIEHAEAAAKARAAGLTVVEDRCLLIEHRRYRAELG